MVLLRAALRYTKEPSVVAREVARSVGMAGLPSPPGLFSLFDRCGLHRSELFRAGLAKGGRNLGATARGQQGKGQSGVVDGLPREARSATSARKRSRSWKRNGE